LIGTVHRRSRFTSTISRLRCAPSKYQKSGVPTSLSAVQQPSPSCRQVRRLGSSVTTAPATETARRGAPSGET
jgi:hypothetical protein